jgi:hypothetical protein
VQIFCESWKELPMRLINVCWKISCPDAVRSFERFDISSTHSEIAIIANEAGFQNVSEDDNSRIVGISFFPINE